MIEKLKRVDDSEFGLKDECGISWSSKSAYLQIEVLGFCGCGVPDDAMLYVKDFLEKVERREYGSYDDMPYVFLHYWASNKGFTEHGTGIISSWLTDLGKELLEDINWCIENEQETGGL